MRELDGFAFASRKLPEYMHPRLIECDLCGMLYADPALSPGTLASAYESAAFDSGIEAYYASATYARHLRKILTLLPDLNGAIDIGTGNGALLEQFLALGFQNVTGVEPSVAPIASAKAQIKPLIRCGIFRPDEFPANSFSVISCFQTLEHLWDPGEITRAAYGLLKPGGAFAVVVHNRRSMSARILGMKSPIFDIEHLQLFCPSTIRNLIERQGFRNIRVSTLLNRYPIRYWVKLLPLPRRLKHRLLRLLAASTLGDVSLSLPAGNLICIGFK